ncbi:MAG: winged helix-turn-helix transcriptional regulator [Nitrosopumilus sp.]
MTREIIIENIITDNPGINYREIMRRSGFKNGVLSHYLDKLERAGTIKSLRSSRQARFFPPQITEDESIIIKFLRKTTTKDIIMSLMIQDGQEFTEIVNNVNKAPSTVSLYLSQLVENQIVLPKISEMKKRYYIQSKMTIDRLIEDNKPTELEKASSGFEDIINSL